MGTIHKKIRGAGGGMVEFHCPACGETHQITVRRDGLNISPAWGYNGNADAPTFTPSIRVTGVQTVVENGKWTGEWVLGPDGKPLPLVCHSFVTDGKIQYLADCTHALAGQTVDLPELKT